MKTLLSVVVSLCAVILLTPSAEASSWIGSDGKTHIKVAACTLVNTRSEADASHVYTLNPDHTIKLNDAYYAVWSRNARCDELQFHVDHSTSLLRLTQWLAAEARSWSENIRGSHLNNQTVSTPRREWFFIQNGVARRIPDILTGWSSGLLVGDRYSIYDGDYFYAHVTIGSPLRFSEGRYADEIHGIWKEGNNDFSMFPTKLASQIDYYHTTSGYGNIFTSCSYNINFPGDPMAALLDWSWMQRNPGCPLAGQ